MPSMSRTAAASIAPPAHRRKRDRLVEQRQPVAHRAVGGARDQAERRGRDRDAFGLGDPAIMLDQLLDRHAPQRKALAARQHGHRHLADLGRREHELDVGRRLFERLQQRVEGVLRQHVDFVDDVDLVARRDRPVAHAVESARGCRRPRYARRRPSRSRRHGGPRRSRGNARIRRRARSSGRRCRRGRRN